MQVLQCKFEVSLACELPKSRWSPPPMDTRNAGGVTSALSVVWKEVRSGLMALYQSRRVRSLGAALALMAVLDSFATVALLTNVRCITQPL
ncbi:hypothetical protein EVAR_19116_1 [Eumeta japonica]|uniref:Uncharacterized protein n=1 Tax=Eumeta variegata TaxID=151549 RepID=A0A4C1UPB0_EUMVA|nr:hypothetical protein EVAR_19116_1 [Eumeta japonica]